jgi:ribosomal-protein-alanine N-acetyltransferase
MRPLPDYRHLSILWADPEGAEDYAALHAELFEQAWDAQSFKRLLAHPASVALVARLGTPLEIAGFIFAQIAADEAEVLTLAVRADRQRHGIATRLIEALIRATKKAEARQLFLEVSATNTAALALYQKLGFERVGQRKGYYEKAGSPPVDAVTLTLML